MSLTNPEIVFPVTSWLLQPSPYGPFTSMSMILTPDFGSVVLIIEALAGVMSLSIPPPLMVLFSTTSDWLNPGNQSAESEASSTAGYVTVLPDTWAPVVSDICSGLFSKPAAETKTLFSTWSPDASAPTSVGEPLSSPRPKWISPF